jgi:hypothetical protein
MESSHAYNPPEDRVNSFRRADSPIVCACREYWYWYCCRAFCLFPPAFAPLCSTLHTFSTQVKSIIHAFVYAKVC